MDELNNYLKEFDLTVNDLTQEEITLFFIKYVHC